MARNAKLIARFAKYAITKNKIILKMVINIK